MLIKIHEIKREITNPEKVHQIFTKILKSEDPVDREKEHFWSVGLDTRNRIKYIELVSLGTLNASLVHPRELFRLAISKAVASIIAAHNHPSGDPTPSQEDLAITRRIVDAGKIIGINVLDHIIVGTTKYSSFKEANLI